VLIVAEPEPEPVSMELAVLKRKRRMRILWIAVIFALLFMCLFIKAVRKRGPSLFKLLFRRKSY